MEYKETIGESKMAKGIGNKMINLKPRSQNFERKLQILRRKRESPRKKEGIGEEWWKNGKRQRNEIPSELFVEGLEQIYRKEENGLKKMVNKWVI